MQKQIILYAFLCGIIGTTQATIDQKVENLEQSLHATNRLLERLEPDFAQGKRAGLKPALEEKRNRLSAELTQARVLQAQEAAARTKVEPVVVAKPEAQPAVDEMDDTDGLHPRLLNTDDLLRQSKMVEADLENEPHSELLAHRQTKSRFSLTKAQKKKLFIALVAAGVLGGGAGVYALRK